MISVHTGTRSFPVTVSASFPRQPRGQAELEEMLALPEARWKVLNLPPVERETNGFSGAHHKAGYFSGKGYVGVG